jgi:uncharacterized damage-inducible protein DinB
MVRIRIVRTVAVLAAVVACSALQASAQTASIHADLTKDWAEAKDTMAKIAAEMPADKFDFKATPAERTYAQQIMHVAQVNMGLLRALGGKAPAPMINMQATSKDDVIKAMNESFDYGSALLKEFNDQTIVEAAPMAPRFMAGATRAKIVYFLLVHTEDIYGQMVVYLRLNGHVPPASQRP